MSSLMKRRSYLKVRAKRLVSMCTYSCIQITLARGDQTEYRYQGPPVACTDSMSQDQSETGTPGPKICNPFICHDHAKPQGHAEKPIDRNHTSQKLDKPREFLEFTYNPYLSLSGARPQHLLSTQITCGGSLSLSSE